MSESLQTSIRISPDFILARHSSPSFGEVDWKSRECTLRIFPRADKLLFAFTTPLSLVNSMARIHVRLLGPCFKTGRRGHQPTRQRDGNRNRALLAIQYMLDSLVRVSRRVGGATDLLSREMETATEHLQVTLVNIHHMTAGIQPVIFKV